MLRRLIERLRSWFASAPAAVSTPSEPIEPVIVDRAGAPILDTTWQPITPTITDWEREAKALRAAYGVCVMERDAAQSGRAPNIEALAYGLMKGLGYEDTSALHHEIGDLLLKRRVSG